MQRECASGASSTGLDPCHVSVGNTTVVKTRSHSWVYHRCLTSAVWGVWCRFFPIGVVSSLTTYCHFCTLLFFCITFATLFITFLHVPLIDTIDSYHFASLSTVSLLIDSVTYRQTTFVSLEQYHFWSICVARRIDHLMISSLMVASLSNHLKTRPLPETKSDPTTKRS